MPEERITITIDGEGDISASTEEFKGETCLEALEKIFEGSLEIKGFKKTDEYFQQNVKTTKRTQKIGEK